MKKTIIGIIIAVVVVGGGIIAYNTSHDKDNTKVATTTMDLSKAKDGDVKNVHPDKAASTYENVTTTTTMDLSKSSDGSSKVNSSSVGNLKAETDLSKSNKFTPNTVIKSTNVISNLNKIIEAKDNSIIVQLSPETLSYISGSDANKESVLKEMEKTYNNKKIYIASSVEVVPVTVSGEGAYAVLFKDMENINNSTDNLMTIINNKGHIYSVSEIAAAWGSGNLEIKGLETVKPYDKFFEDGYKGQSPEGFFKSNGKLVDGSYIAFGN